jgi:hypothetical protein
LLQRQGCASAYCHGAATGQGGFKLSLFGSDAHADHAAITQALGGRRIDLLAPDASLLLEKPTRRLPHGGGKKIVLGSDEYQRLRRWIAAGAPFASEPPRTLRALTLHVQDDRVRARARFDAGGDLAERDVSALAEFSTSDERIASVDTQGRITWHGDGEAFLFARYAGTTARVAVLRPRGKVTAPAPASTHPLDTVFFARLGELGIAPGLPAPAARIARRLFLDLAGRPPTAFELDRFLAAPEHERVAQTTDALLASPAFTDVTTRAVLAWFDAGGDAAETLARTVREHVAADAPWSAFTAALLAPGSGFYRRQQDPRDRAEHVARTLLGTRIGCARCHDHPHDRWRQTDYLAFAACLSGSADVMAGTAAETAMTPAMSPALYDEHTGAAITPRLLPLPRASSATDLHTFLHDPAHDLAARTLCNRVFAWLLGRGLVEPLDDHRDTNPARHESWLAALQQTFHQGGGRLRPLVRAVVTSAVYQLDSANDRAGDDNDATWFAHRTAKPLHGEHLSRAMAAVLEVDHDLLAGLPSSPLARRLALLHSGRLPRAARAPANAVAVLRDLGGSPQEQLGAAFVACLTRAPTPAEREALLPDLDTGRTTIRDVVHGLLLSREFEFVR